VKDEPGEKQGECELVLTNPPVRQEEECYDPTSGTDEQKSRSSSNRDALP